VKSVV
jgi:hypothetical protein